MGAEQSSARGGAQQAAQATERKTCYYELLGIDRQAPEEEYTTPENMSSTLC